jgi:hypothetical protein
MDIFELIQGLVSASKKHSLRGSREKTEREEIEFEFEFAKRQIYEHLIDYIPSRAHLRRLKSIQ